MSSEPAAEASNELYRQLVASGARTHDEYVSFQISRSHDVHVGPRFGLDETETRNLIEQLLQNIESDRYDRAQREYFAALQKYCRSAYRVLAPRFPESIDLEAIYVPVRMAAKESSSAIYDSLGSALAAGKPCLLIGDPGAGKSTTLRHIARNAWHNPAELGLKEPNIPLPVRLQVLATIEAAGREERIARALNQAQELEFERSGPPPGFYTVWPNRLKSRWLLLLDGFDEVPPEQRGDVEGWIARLIADGAQVVVTTRPTDGMTRAFKSRFEQFELQPFSQEQQRMLAAKWLGDGQAEIFIEAFRRLGYQNLGGTPLLTTIALIVFLEEGSLPSTRAVLYRQFVRCWWQEALNRGARAELGETLADIAPFCLQRLALEMTESYAAGQTLDLGSDLVTAQRILKKSLVDGAGVAPALAETQATRLLECFGRRSGVFLVKGPGVAWLHPTFREFLAAEAIAADGERIRETIDRFGEDHWREVILYLLGILSERGPVTELVRHLASLSPPRGAIYAGRAIGAGVFVSEDLAREVIQTLCELVGEHASGWLCERLLTRSYGEQASAKALASLRYNSLAQPYLDKLEHQLEEICCAYGKENPYAISLLEDMGGRDGLARLALRKDVPTPVRADAAGKLFAIAGADSLAAVAVILKDDPPNGVQEIARVAGYRGGLLSGLIERVEDFSEVIEATATTLITSDNEEALRRLSASARVSSAVRAIASLYLHRNDDKAAHESLQQVLASNSRKFARTACNILAAAKRWEELRWVAENAPQTSGLHRPALKALCANNQLQHLTSVAANSAAPYKFRRIAADYAVLLQPDEQQRSQMLDFFKPFADRGKCVGPKRLVGILLAQSGKYEQALEYLTFWQMQSSSNLVALNYAGLCAQEIGWDWFATATYQRAVDIGIANEFTNLRLAYLRHQSGEHEKVLERLATINEESWPNWILRFAGNSLRHLNRLDDADRVLRRAADVAELDEDRAMIAAFHAMLRMFRGELGQAIEELTPLGTSFPNFKWAQLQRAHILRVAGRFNEACLAFTTLLEQSPEDQIIRSIRAETAVRAGALTVAESDIVQLREQSPDIQWYEYLSSMVAAFKGSPSELKETLLRMPDSIEPEVNDPTLLSNHALILAARGRTDAAKAILQGLIQRNSWEHLRLFSVAEFDDLSAALPGDTQIRGLRDWLKATLWPAPTAPSKSPATKSKVPQQSLPHPSSLKRGKYPFPMYCQRSEIEGLAADKKLAEEVLRTKVGERTIVCWTLDRDDRVYGHCNFRQATGSEHNLKFCDSLETTLQHNLQVFTDTYGVRNWLFLEPELKMKFDAALRRSQTPVATVLVKQPE